MWFVNDYRVYGHWKEEISDMQKAAQSDRVLGRTAQGFPQPEFSLGFFNYICERHVALAVIIHLKTAP